MPRGDFFFVPFKKSLLLLCNGKELVENIKCVLLCLLRLSSIRPLRVLRGSRCLHALVLRKKVRLCFDNLRWIHLLHIVLSVVFFTEGRSVTGYSSGGASQRNVCFFV